CNFSATPRGGPSSFASGHVALATRPPAFEQAVCSDEAAGHAALVMFHPPRQQLLAVGQHQRHVTGIVGKIGELSRVLLEIEEERRQGSEMHVFVAMIA